MSESPKAVIFGAGKVACGLLGRLLCHSGYDSLFVARRPEVIDAIEHNHGYSLNLLQSTARPLKVTGCSAVSILDSSSVVNAVARADVVFTAVGIDNLAAIAPAVAAGLWCRARFGDKEALNVVACENLPGAGAYLRHQIVSSASTDGALVVDNIGGFSAALTRQIMTGGRVSQRCISFNVEGDADVVVDRKGLRPPLPQMQGMLLTDQFSAMVMCKLFTLNCAHAVAAYLGYREGCEYIHEAAVHPRVAPVLAGAVGEARVALRAEFPEHADEIDRQAAEALERIMEPRLVDLVTRVARGPRRKLSPRERLVGAAKLAVRHHLPNDNLCRAIAAALTYGHADDAEAVAMQRAIAAHGIERVITEDCGLLPHEELARAVKHQWHQLTGIQGAKANSPAAIPLEKIKARLTSELAQQFNSDQVADVMDRVAGQFHEARVWNFVQILMKRAALKELAAELR